MFDTFNRKINYLRISITDRCNLRCVYCMPPQGVEHLPHEEILSLEEIATLVSASTSAGIRKVRLTGGEPLVRKGVSGLVKTISSMGLIDDTALTTNGILLESMAKELKNSGLRRVNISLDTLDPKRYKEITGMESLEEVKRGIFTTLKLQLHPVKINAVIARGINDDEVTGLAKLTLDYPLHIRFIEIMPIGNCNDWAKTRYVSSDEIFNRLESSFGKLQVVKKSLGAGPARYYRMQAAQGTIGFINAISNHFCTDCNRLRLTSIGKLRPCLCSDWELDLKGPLRSGATLQELSKLFGQAAGQKPKQHNMDSGWKDKSRVMSQLGG